MAADLFVDVLTLGMWQANCYVVGDRSSGRAFVVDPGQDGAEPVRHLLAERGVVCEAVLLTHGHLDHLWSAPELARDLDVPVRMHEDDRWLWDSPAAAFGAPDAMLQEQFGLVWDPPTERLETFADGDVMTLAGLRVTARHTPGHTPGSSVFLTDDPSGDPLMLSGDLLFAGSVGRTDFPRGSWAEQAESLRRVVLPLDDATVVRSGHGPVTTVGRERRTNPYVQEAAVTGRAG
jgi:hydroxyacylglutathione hydrolase